MPIQESPIRTKTLRKVGFRSQNRATKCEPDANVLKFYIAPILNGLR